VDGHPDAAFWLAVVLPAALAGLGVAPGILAGRWSRARFAPMVAWVGYLVVVIVSSPRS
jgi:hypothetical protein